MLGWLRSTLLALPLLGLLLFIIVNLRRDRISLVAVFAPFVVLLVQILLSLDIVPCSHNNLHIPLAGLR